MGNSERVTVTLPSEVIRGIDQREKNRSKFVLEAVRRELMRRRREELQSSLRSPHGESAALAEEGFGEWARGLPDEDLTEVVDVNAGVSVRWVPGKGWLTGHK